MATRWIDLDPDAWDYLEVVEETSTYKLKYKLLVEWTGKRTTMIEAHPIISGAGADPAALRREPSVISFTVKVYDQKSIDNYESALAFMLGKGGASGSQPYGPWPKAFPVSHPALAMLGITQMFLKSATPLRRASAREPATATLEFIEFLPAQFVRPKSVATDQSKGTQAGEKPSASAGKTTK